MIHKTGREVVGSYHSHPDGPLTPSETDTARAMWSGYSYLILSALLIIFKLKAATV
ncbi:Mov34/MPN/PAD-1 family protein [Haloquadratum walsbyi]|uniref:JAB domain-containing protein n=1 Tax=Haloquadratum walsbyi J07HQW2 TaxID=1238425 RepID=U1NF86_9EURY|nr:Mov34/MPN/PAD-1 family protein [Haloquadratum walsbyi]ERG95443.1 MAG: hypothetical protein J07HQW2_01900 [Haloquadratum walsbyi J07HQW2]